VSPFATRTFEPELMDLPDADRRKLLRTIAQFDIINRLFSRSGAVLNRFVIAPNRRARTPFTIADVGSGGGDIMRRMVRSCRDIALPVQAVCIDRDERILAHAKGACHAYPEIEVRQGDVTELKALGPFDYVFCNNFLHHFPDKEIPGILSLLHDSAKRTLLVSDLARSPFAYMGFALFAALFLHRSFAGFDGRLSIRKGFTSSELAAFAAEAGLSDGCRVVQLVPARLLLVMDKTV
jgi:2-polyprenyl-3-methyl-5-hydroxy-6-metoxy-1,4-benzoquinol methylase